MISSANGQSAPSRWPGASFVWPERTLVMGVLNLTPDSFFDGGRYVQPEAALRRALAMVEEGADFLDIGAESTRPGAAPVEAAEQWQRLEPVLKALAGRVTVPISVDTTLASVAELALDAGGAAINDVSGLADPRMADVVAAADAGLIVMHMQGIPHSMQQDPSYEDVVSEVSAFLSARAERAVRSGVVRESVIVDPGIGFGKTLDHNLALLRSMRVLASAGWPVLMGVSRKSFIGALGGAPVEARLPGSIAAALSVSRDGAAMVRVHDVAETVQALRVQRSIAGGVLE